jgi:hypothetical protein
MQGYCSYACNTVWMSTAGVLQGNCSYPFCTVCVSHSGPLIRSLAPWLFKVLTGFAGSVEHVVSAAHGSIVVAGGGSDSALVTLIG